ncbi:hypothetical protein [Otoolea muris]
MPGMNFQTRSSTSFTN